jgi:hypothetical protein
MDEVPRYEWTEEQKKEFTKFTKLNSYEFNDLQYCNVTSDRKFDHLKQGGIFYCDKIILVDKKKNVVVTKDDYGRIWWFYISNPFEKPSLYSKAEIEHLIY